jgi:thiol-disulfide isomerase/thioredoxin
MCGAAARWGKKFASFTARAFAKVSNRSSHGVGGRAGLAIKAPDYKAWYLLTSERNKLRSTGVEDREFVKISMRRRLRSCALAGVLVLCAGRTFATQPFPDLDLEGKDGGTLRISQLKGNVVVINFWATWCGPCRMELPLLQDLYNRYSDRNFTVLAVDVDVDRNRVAPFLKTNNLSLPVYYTNPADANAMTANGIPTTFIIDPSGNIEKGFVGFEPNIEKVWIEHITPLLKKRKPKA